MGSHNGSYLALAEVNFLALLDVMCVQLFPVFEAGRVTGVECRDPTGSMFSTVVLRDDDNSVLGFRKLLDATLPAPFKAVLPDGRLLSDLEGNEPIEQILLSR